MTILTAFLLLPGLHCQVTPRSLVDLTRGSKRYQVKFHSAERPAAEALRSENRSYAVRCNNTNWSCDLPTFQARDRSQHPQAELPNAAEVAAMDLAVGEFIGNQCVRTRNSWWFFELCWGKYLGQYHYRDENSAVKEEEIYLFHSSSSDAPVTFQRTSDGNAEPYLSYHYGNGSWCREMATNRTTEVRAYCNRPGGHTTPHLQFDIVQPNSCHHVVSFYTEALCPFPWFQPMIRTEFIDCYLLPSSDDAEGGERSEGN